MVVDSGKTKLEELLTLDPRAHVIIRNERLIKYEQIVEQASLSTGDIEDDEKLFRLIDELRSMEPISRE